MEFTFVLGCARSGTTFLSGAINRVPRTVCRNGKILLPATVGIHASRADGQADVQSALEQSFFLELTEAAAIYGRGERLLRVLRGYASPGELLDRQPRLDHFVFKEPFLSFSPGLALRPFPASGVGLAGAQL